MNRKPTKDELASLSHDELVRECGRLHDSNHGLRQHNAAVTKWASRVGEAVTTLATDGSLAFQAMAERAGVRAHPSVAQTLRAFDAISHPQWEKEEVQFPSNWDFDAVANPDMPDGDADMILNSALYKETSETPPWEKSKMSAEVYEAFLNSLQQRLIELRSAAGFRPKEVCVRSVPDDFGMVLLDIAQHMNFARHMLRRDLRAAAYLQVERDIYRLCWHEPERQDEAFLIAIFGNVDAA